MWNCVPPPIIVKWCSTQPVQLYKDPWIRCCAGPRGHKKKSEVVTTPVLLHSYPVVRSPEYQDLWSSCLSILEARTLPMTGTWVSQELMAKEAQIWGSPYMIAHSPQFPQEQILKSGWDTQGHGHEKVRREDPSGKASRFTAAIIRIGGKLESTCTSIRNG